jgi:membrane associated rhomboid family serine protease
MFIPIGDTPNPEETPWATYALIALNMLVWLLICRPATFEGVDPFDPQVLKYLATMRQATGQSVPALLADLSAYDVLTFHYGFRPAHPTLTGLFTSLFLHAGWLHVLGNMLFLWIFGDNVEARLGPKKFIVLYLGAGVAATLFYGLARANSPLPLIGASGAVSGILGTYFVWFPHNRVRVVMTLLIFIQIIHVPARIVLGFYLLIENVVPFLFSGTGSTAYGAHIGGFIAGATFALGHTHHQVTGSWGNMSDWLATARRHSPPKPPSDPSFQSSYTKPFDAGSPSAESVTRAVLARRYDDALEAYLVLSPDERQRIDPQTCFDLADAFTQRRAFSHGIGILQRYLADHPSGPPLHLAQAHLRLGLLHLRGLAASTAARQHLLAVIDLLPASDEAEAAKMALRDCD